MAVVAQARSDARNARTRLVGLQNRPRRAELSPLARRVPTSRATFVLIFDHRHEFSLHLACAVKSADVVHAGRAIRRMMGRLFNLMDEDLVEFMEDEADDHFEFKMKTTHWSERYRFSWCLSLSLWCRRTATEVRC
eukprot:82546-Rhodomonas_salina.2